MMTERTFALGDERLHFADRRRLLRLVASAAVAMPLLAVAGCADNGNGDGDGEGQKSNWDPGWKAGKRGMSGDGNGGGGGNGNNSGGGFNH
jgi:hypothetical protein